MVTSSARWHRERPYYDAFLLFALGVLVLGLLLGIALLTALGVAWAISAVTVMWVSYPGEGEEAP